MEKLTVELCKVFPYYTIVHDSDLDDDMEDIDHFVIAAFVPKLSKAELRENRETDRKRPPTYCVVVFELVGDVRERE